MKKIINVRREGLDMDRWNAIRARNPRVVVMSPRNFASLVVAYGRDIDIIMDWRTVWVDGEGDNHVGNMGGVEIHLQLPRVIV